MKKSTWYRFVWEDGSVSVCRGYSKTEMYWQVKNHGKLISKTVEGYF